jgi:hypothetical protein
MVVSHKPCMIRSKIARLTRLRSCLFQTAVRSSVGGRGGPDPGNAVFISLLVRLPKHSPKYIRTIHELSEDTNDHKRFCVGYLHQPRLLPYVRVASVPW